VITHQEEISMDAMVELANPVRGASEAYILHECSQLRDEIWTRVEDQRATERYMLLACAVIYSFLVLHLQDGKTASDEIRILVGCAWYVPPLLAFLAAARWCENVRLIRLIADYTHLREQQILGGPEGGWESYLRRVNKRHAPSILASGYYIAFWLFLIFSTITIAAYQHSLYITTTWRLSTALFVGAFAAMATLAVIAHPMMTIMSRIRGSKQACSDATEAQPADIAAAHRLAIDDAGAGAQTA
jgi:hypothetical protein